MKNIYFLSSLLFLTTFTGVVHAQYQRVFDPDKAPIVWTQPIYGFSGNLGGIEKIHYFGKDTIINGKTIKADTIINGQHLNIAYKIPPSISFLYYEDTVEGKVIEYRFNSSGNITFERLIMHLNVQVGDTIPPYVFMNPAIVDSIFTLKGRKHISLIDYYSVPMPNGSTFSANRSYFIEGIGNTRTMTMYTLREDHSAVICMKTKDSVEYMAPFTDTCWLRGLHTQQWEEAQPSVFSIHPNPVTDVFSVSATFPLETYSVWKLTDAMGKEIRTGILANDELSIDIRALPSGVYFFRIQYKQEVYLHKVMKQ
ncbi:MAG: T9SS type A sorting domain-containing protein [Cryomorphaceae bacterium]|nr:T9SS type A sorting domain-containing protein [Cryomorphaceae bacterium]